MKANKVTLILGSSKLAFGRSYTSEEFLKFYDELFNVIFNFHKYINQYFHNLDYKGMHVSICLGCGAFDMMSSFQTAINFIFCNDSKSYFAFKKLLSKILNTSK